MSNDKGEHDRAVEDADREYSEVDADDVVDDAVEFFDTPSEGPPVSKTDTPPPG